MLRVRFENVVASTVVRRTARPSQDRHEARRCGGPTQRFPGLIYRLKEPKTAVLLFRSGKAVCTGGRSWNQADFAVRRVSELIRKGGRKGPGPSGPPDSNTVATWDLATDLNLNSTAVTFGLDRVESEPERFPGLVCRLEDPRVVVLLFRSGKLVCTGAGVDLRMWVGASPDHPRAPECWPAGSRAKPRVADAESGDPPRLPHRGGVVPASSGTERGGRSLANMPRSNHRIEVVEGRVLERLTSWSLVVHRRSVRFGGLRHHGIASARQLVLPS